MTHTGCCRIFSGRLSISDYSILGNVFTDCLCLKRIGEIASVSKQGAPSPPQLYQLIKLLHAASELAAFEVTYGKFS